MAITIYGGTGAATIAQTPGSSVWVRQYHSDSWTWVPWLYWDTCSQTVSPSVDQAQFTYDFGRMKRADLYDWGLFAPLSLNGWEIRIYIHNYWGMWVLWTGVVEVEEDEVYGAVPGYYFETGAQPFDGGTAYVGIMAGRQHFTAYGIEHVLDRVEVHGAFTDRGFVDRDVAFNARRRVGLSWYGNRSTASVGTCEIGGEEASMADMVVYRYQGYNHIGCAAHVTNLRNARILGPAPLDAGIYDFSTDGATWTALDALRYLLVRYSPYPIILAGDYSVLASISEEWHMAGGTLKQCIEELISRFRGLGWRIWWMFDGSLVLYVFTQFSESVSAYNHTIPANADQSLIVLDNNLWVEPTVSYNYLTGFDLIRVQGNQIGMCFTVSFDDSTLEEGWTETEETAYKAGSTKPGASNKDHDMERTTDKFRVYQRFKVPDNWDWQAGDGAGGTKVNASPLILDDATLDDTQTANEWTEQLSFERSLPLYHNSGDGHDSEPRLPFALLKDTSNKYHYLDKLSAISQSQDNWNVQVADTELAILVKPSNVPHLFAKNHFSESNTAFKYIFDYETLVATVFVKLDQKVGVNYWMPSFNQVGVLRVKRIQIDDAELWQILPGTVTDVTNGELVHDTTGTTVRDDRDRLRRIAVFAAAYYGRHRGTCTLQIKDFTFANPAGSMILGLLVTPNFRLMPGGVPVLASGYVIDVATVVTSQSWTWTEEGMFTEISTGFEEVDRVG